MTKERIDNTQLLKDSGCRVRHIRKNDDMDNPGSTSTRDVTIAYKDGGSVLEIATAVVHPNDKFCRKVGTKLAVESFLSGKTVRVPKSLGFSFRERRPASPIATLNSMFGVY